MKHTPIQRIRNTPIGSTVKVPGILNYRAKHEFYLGERSDDGYGLLWPSLECWQKGLNWVVMATGSHPVEVLN
jgi:hypothetical protein